MTILTFNSSITFCTFALVFKWTQGRCSHCKSVHTTIAADKILADFARILSLLKGVELSFLYNKLVVDLVPIEHILMDSNPETA